MPFPFACKRFVAETSDRAQARWAGEHGDVLPLLVTLQDLDRNLPGREDLVDVAMLFNSPHATSWLVHISTVKRRTQSRQELPWWRYRLCKTCITAPWVHASPPSTICPFQLRSSGTGASNSISTGTVR